MVMGGGSCSNGREFEYWQSIMDGHFFTYIFVVKFVPDVFEKTKINEKKDGVGPFLKKNCSLVKYILVCLERKFGLVGG